MDSKANPPTGGDERPPAAVVDENLTLEQWIKDKQEYKEFPWPREVLDEAATEELRRRCEEVKNAKLDLSRVARLR